MTVTVLILAICFFGVVLGSDTKCTTNHGFCQEDNLFCSGSYLTGLCSGHASRRCCVPSTGTTETLDCTGTRRYHARGTAYYPANDPIEGGFYDMHGKPLHTLQDFLERTSNVVVVAMDNRAGIAYDTKVCIPELYHKYNRVIDFRVRDTGSAFFHKGYSRIDICVRNKYDSYDGTINGPLSLVFH